MSDPADLPLPEAAARLREGRLTSVGLVEAAPDEPRAAHADRARSPPPQGTASVAFGWQAEHGRHSAGGATAAVPADGSKYPSLHAHVSGFQLAGPGSNARQGRGSSPAPRSGRHRSHRPGPGIVPSQNPEALSGPCQAKGCTGRPRPVPRALGGRRRRRRGGRVRMGRSPAALGRRPWRGTSRPVRSRTAPGGPWRVQAGTKLAALLPGAPETRPPRTGRTGGPDRPPAAPGGRRAGRGGGRAPRSGTPERRQASWGSRRGPPPWPGRAPGRRRRGAAAAAGPDSPPDCPGRRRRTRPAQAAEESLGRLPSRKACSALRRWASGPPERLAWRGLGTAGQRPRPGARERRRSSTASGARRGPIPGALQSCLWRKRTAVRSACLLS